MFIGLFIKTLQNRRRAVFSFAPPGRPAFRAGFAPDGAGGAHRGASCVLVKAPFWEVDFLFLEYHSFVGKCTHISFVGDAPPSSFSPCAEKKKSAVHGGEEKEGFWVQTCYNFVSILLRSFVEHGAAWRSVVTLPVLLTALRAGAGLGRCAVRSVFFCCASIARVYRGCTAADLFRCISLFAVAAQCAL